MRIMKRIIVYFCICLFVFISCIVICSFAFRDRSIQITDEMLVEETEMESAWDFKQNLNIGWNLGMSFSSNIKYPEIIKYYVEIDNVKTDLLDPLKVNTINLTNKTKSSPTLIFDIPYTALDGILTWSIEYLSFNNQEVVVNKLFESEVIDGKVSVCLDNYTSLYYQDLSVNIKIHKFYEYDTLEKVEFYEIFWGKTKTSKQLFISLKEKGFNAIRISFDVYNHINDQGKIDSLWLNRLKEVVDYCMELDMYCLIDIVETYGLYVDNLTDESVSLYISLWKQLANVFRKYDDKLLFAPFNEIRNTNGDWGTTDLNCLNNMNKLYQIFVDTIRASGANNRYRNLLLSCYGTGINKYMLDQFVIPEDSTYNHLLFECHYYDPVRFTFNEINLGNTDFEYEWGSLSDKERLVDAFKIVNEFMKKNKIPLIITEFGVVDRISLDERIEYLEYYKKIAKKYKVGLFIFDDAHDFAIIDRETCEFYENELVDVLTK